MIGTFLRVCEQALFFKVVGPRVPHLFIPSVVIFRSKKTHKHKLFRRARSVVCPCVKFISFLLAAVSMHTLLRGLIATKSATFQEVQVLGVHEARWGPEEEEEEVLIAVTDRVCLGAPVQVAEPPVHDERSLTADTSASACFTNFSSWRLVYVTARSKDFDLVFSMGEGGSCDPGL